MKLNISYPTTGCQKVLEIDDDNKLRAFYDKRMSSEVAGEHLGDEFKGYIFKISGGNDKQGFPMKQGVLTASRVRLLLSDGHSCYRPRKRGERKRKSVRGCIVSSDLSVLNLVVVKKGEQEIEGLTDQQKPRRLGPKRASKIRKLFNLDKEDDVRKYVIRREIKKDGKKSVWKAPKIQRLITPRRLQHKRQRLALKRERWQKTQAEAKEFNELLAKRAKEQREQRLAKHAANRKQSAAEQTKGATEKATVDASKKSQQVKPTTAKPATAKPAATAKSTTQTAGTSKQSAPQAKQPAKADKQVAKKAPTKK